MAKKDLIQDILISLPAEIIAHLDDSESPKSLALLTMLGSLCPVTSAHIQSMVQARALLLEESFGENFHMVLGFIALNSDEHVAHKMALGGEDYFTLTERAHLVQLAVKNYSWLNYCTLKGSRVLRAFKARWPNLSCTHYTVNGADDVVKHEKWLWAGRNRRMITMGRSGSMDALWEGMERDAVECSPYFIVGPEVSVVSSTDVRAALRRRDKRLLKELLHPDVADWCLKYGPYRFS